MTRRDWTEARAKVEDEGVCRYCGVSDGGRAIGYGGYMTRARLEAAHLWPRSQGGGQHPDGIVPLCGECHRRFDSGEIDLLADLRLEEQIETVRQAGSLERARRRLAPVSYRESR